MKFDKLLCTTRGKIILVNTADMALANTVEEKDLRLVKKGMLSALGKLKKTRSWKALLSEIEKVLFPNAHHFHLLSLEQPCPLLYIAAVRTFQHVRPWLVDLYKVHKDDRELRYATDKNPTDRAMARVGEIVKRYAPRNKGMILGKPQNIFWATTADEVRRVEEEALLAGRSFPHAIRDRLGLVQFRPGKKGQPLHLFLFTALIPIGELAKDNDFLIRRTTAIEGFDNPRFRQRISPSLKGLGCGQTVDLTDGKFSEGAQEFALTQLPVTNSFSCRWIGKVTAPAEGSDQEFLTYLRDRRPFDYFTDVLDGIK